MMLIYTNDPLQQSLCHQQPLNRLMHSKGCSLIMSASLLGVGVTITVMSLQSFSASNKIFLIGPVLMTIGIIGLSRFLVQYLKKKEGRHRRERRTPSQRRHERHYPTPPSRELITSVASHVPYLPRPPHVVLAQRESSHDSEVAIYQEPSDSEGGYSDDPPPYDAVDTVTGLTIPSRVQVSGDLSGSLPSLPPYEEGLTNPALDISAEGLPCPPPYEVVAVQPPSYSPGLQLGTTPVMAARQHIRRKRRKSRDPTRQTVRQVAERLAQSMQQAEATQRSMVAEVGEPTEIIGDLSRSCVSDNISWNGSARGLNECGNPQSSDNDLHKSNNSLQISINDLQMSHDDLRVSNSDFQQSDDDLQRSEYDLLGSNNVHSVSNIVTLSHCQIFNNTQVPYNSHRPLSQIGTDLEISDVQGRSQAAHVSEPGNIEGDHYGNHGTMQMWMEGNEWNSCSIVDSPQVAPPNVMHTPQMAPPSDVAVTQTQSLCSNAPCNEQLNNHATNIQIILENRILHDESTGHFLTSAEMPLCELDVDNDNIPVVNKGPCIEASHSLT